MDPDVDRRVALRPVQSASAYAVCELELMADRGRKMFMSIVPDMYLTIRFARTMCLYFGAPRRLIKTYIAMKMSNLVDMAEYDKQRINNRYQG